jgi:hypothetical protein
MATNTERPILYPSLSEDSWVSSPLKKADYLFSTFFVADYSQTYLYKGRVSSFPYILQSTLGNVSETCAVTRETLLTYFTRFFNNVVVEVEEVPNLEAPSKAQISIYVRFTDIDKKEHVLGKMLQYQDTIISKIITMNNG